MWKTNADMADLSKSARRMLKADTAKAERKKAKEQTKRVLEARDAEKTASSAAATYRPSSMEPREDAPETAAAERDVR